MHGRDEDSKDREHHHHHAERHHDPEHGPEHAHEHEALRVEPIARGAGEGKVLFFDTFSGVSGDMTIAALLGLGVPLLAVESAIARLPIEGFHLHRGHSHRSGILATSFHVHVEAEQPLRTWADIDAMLERSSLEDPVRSLARAIFLRLGQAEAEVHGMPLRDVHFHEVGAVDAIVDIVGAAAGLTWLGAEVVCAPLPMGRGFIQAAHGVLPNPPPAVVACLRGAPTVSVDLDLELVTPTGAAIVATVAKAFSRWPALAPVRVGYGAGSRDLPDRPNVLRLVLGDRAEEATQTAHDRAPYAVLEANVDDLTGELAAHVLAELLAMGALDAWAAPVTMKKGRPGLVLAALCPAAMADAVSATLLRESTTIGVRRTPVWRVERPRRIETVETPFGRVRVKVSGGPYGPPLTKPELEDCAALARARGVPLREVLSAATDAARRLPP